jgi:sporulation protein YlmC with PRC-barrel domain
MLKTGASVAVLAVLIGATATMAQTPPPAPRPAPAPAVTEVPKTPVTGQILVQDSNTVLAKDLIGLTVYAPDKAKIGSISDLILSKDAKTVDGFIIGVGGFLGIGEKSVALKMDRLQMSQNGDGSIQLMMDVKKEELTNAPSFKSKKDQDAEKQAAERSRNQPPAQQQRPPVQR